MAPTTNPSSPGASPANRGKNSAPAAISTSTPLRKRTPADTGTNDTRSPETPLRSRPRGSHVPPRRSSVVVGSVIVESLRVVAEYFCGVLLVFVLPIALASYVIPASFSSSSDIFGETPFTFLFQLLSDETFLFLSLWCTVLFGSVYLFLSMFDRIFERKLNRALTNSNGRGPMFTAGIVEQEIMMKNTSESDEVFEQSASGAWIAPHGRLKAYPVGARLQMGFRRQEFTWTEQHIPGEVLRQWEYITDGPGDKLFADFGKSLTSEQFIGKLKDGKIAKLPPWVDMQLLEEGCRFYRSLWPFVSYQFSWAVVGGFGAEAASAVLLKTRYWADQGPDGKIDTWNRLRETLCFLYDICGHGAKGFEEDGAAWRSCLLVRFLHARTREGVWRKYGNAGGAAGVPRTSPRTQRNDNAAAPGAGTASSSGDEQEEDEHPDGRHNVERTKSSVVELHDTSAGSGHHAAAAPPHEDTWDFQKFGEPINQAELIGTLMGCSLLLLDGIDETVLKIPFPGQKLRDKFQVKVPTRQKEAFTHLWRVVGFLFGIRDDLNPNKSYAEGKIVMESLYTFGIPAAPDPKLSAVLANHIMESVAEGVNTQLVNFVTPAMVSTPAWLFLGEEYSKALRLPEISLKDRVLGSIRKWTLGAFLFVYFLLYPLLDASGLVRVVEAGMHFLFRVACRQVWATQPKCRFAKALCPFGGGGRDQGAAEIKGRKVRETESKEDKKTR